ncbi:MAG: hypothetical protein PHU46_11345 [Rhodocyclaceae bacterium]|nr:hypothetical protein [Rhodocyclaceae bacterium]
MGYAELIKTLENLPPDRRAEVFDFGEFLAARCQRETAPATTNQERPLAEFLNSPLAVKEPFKPMSRDELYDRACLR